MLAAAVALTALALGCARLLDGRARIAFDALALAGLAHFKGLALEGAALTGVLAAEALALAGLARRRRDALAGWGAAGFATIGLVHALAVVAPPDALFSGLEAPLAAAAALIAVAAAFAAAAQVVPRRALSAPAALTLLFLVSVELVTAAGPERTSQTLVSVLWALTGVSALVAGLARDDRALRRGALALIAVTATKVFLYDLASLDSLPRVGSLIGFGVLLLAGSFAWQRTRPRQPRAA
jgi:hypothetical protein